MTMFKILFYAVQGGGDSNRTYIAIRIREKSYYVPSFQRARSWLYAYINFAAINELDTRKDDHEILLQRHTTNTAKLCKIGLDSLASNSFPEGPGSSLVCAQQ